MGGIIERGIGIKGSRSLRIIDKGNSSTSRVVGETQSIGSIANGIGSRTGSKRRDAAGRYVSRSRRSGPGTVHTSDGTRTGYVSGGSKKLYLLLVLVLMVKAKQLVQQLVLSKLLSLSLLMLNLLLQLTLFLLPMLLVIDP